MDRLPKTRTDIQLLPANLRGRQVFAVRDLLDLEKEAVALAPELIRLLPLFDGEHSIRDLQVALMRQRGNQLVMPEEAQQMVSKLDNLLLLQTVHYQEKKQALKKAFALLDHRPSFHAGKAYPSNSDALNSMLEKLLSNVELNPSLDPSRTRALIAPHIDLGVGEKTYAKAYAALRGTRPKRLVVLGTGHAIEEGLFALTTKDYLTPLGSFPTDQEAVRILRGAGGDLVAPDEFAHRAEHAIEFQLVFLRYLFSGDIPVVPVLFGSFGPTLPEADRPSQIPKVAAFLKALAEMMDEGTLLVAGVDLSHVGPKFGDPEPASHHQEEFRFHDQALLEALCAGSATGFWAEGKRVDDRYHVCGFPVLACLLEILPGLEGQVLDYQIWHERPTSSAVSFAAVVLNER